MVYCDFIIKTLLYMTNWKEILKDLKNNKQANFNELSALDKELIKDLINLNTIDDSIELLDSIDIDEEWLHIKNQTLQKQNFITSKKQPINRLMRYAAVLAIFVLLGYFSISLRNSSYLSKRITEHEFLPATSHDQGFLVLSNGSKLNLKDIENDIPNSHFKLIDSKRLDYSTAKSGTETEFNRLIIPRGSEYHLKLNDGTEIHLNSESELKFPVSFTGLTNREVFLEKGEAFFDVAKNTDQPFIVNIKDIKVSVLGTSFNINDYNKLISTTLVEGKVKVQNNNESVIINPNQQVIFNKSDNKFIVKDVDVSSFIGWKENQWTFEDSPLEDIMSSLSRWYDYEIIFEDEDIKTLQYAIRLQKYSNIKDILYLLEKTDKIYFTLKGRKIYVHKSKD